MRRTPLSRLLSRKPRATPAAGNRFVPRLVQLEGRECPSLTAGENENMGGEVDNQQNVSVAIDPTNPLHIVEAHMSWRGGYNYPNPFAPNQGHGYGFVVRASHDGGLTWSFRYTATGTPVGEALPAAAGYVNARPQVAFDKFGNLFMAYNSGGQVTAGTGTMTTTGLTVPGANWVSNQLAGQRVHLSSGWGAGQWQTILSNTANTITVANWSSPPSPGSTDFEVFVPPLGGTDIVVALSIDQGDSFRYVTRWGPHVMSEYAAQLTPLIATGPGSGGSGYDQYSSVWVGYMVQRTPHIHGALVTGSLDPLDPNYGTMGAFMTPTAPSQWAPNGSYGQLGGGSQLQGLSVGPAGQPLISYQDYNPTTVWTYPPPGQYGYPTMENRWLVYTTAAPNGLSAGSAFNTPTRTVDARVSRYYAIPAMKSATILGNTSYAGTDASAGVTYDRTGAHPGRAYLVYADAVAKDSPNTNIYLKYSDNNGATWSAPAQVNDDATATSQFMPQAAIDEATGDLAITWYDAREDTTNNKLVRLYGTVRGAGGTTFEPNARLSFAVSPIPDNPINGTIVNNQSYGIATGIDGVGPVYGLTDTNQNWRPNQWGVGPDIVAFDVHTYGGNPNIARGLIEGNSSDTITFPWWQDYPPTGSNLTYIIGPMYGSALGEYTGLIFHDGKFLAMWADNSNNTGDNPDIAQSTLEVYASWVEYTPSGGSGGGSGSGSGSGSGGGGYMPRAAPSSYNPPESKSKVMVDPKEGLSTAAETTVLAGPTKADDELSTAKSATLIETAVTGVSESGTPEPGGAEWWRI